MVIQTVTVCVVVCVVVCATILQNNYHGLIESNMVKAGCRKGVGYSRRGHHSKGMRREAERPQGSDSHIPQCVVYQAHTATPQPPTLIPLLQRPNPDLGSSETAIIPPPGELGKGHYWSKYGRQGVMGTGSTDNNFNNNNTKIKKTS